MINERNYKHIIFLTCTRILTNSTTFGKKNKNDQQLVQVNERSAAAHSVISDDAEDKPG
jgi:hypothetical protein